ncbi:MAG: hypothetical protein Kow0063_39360 [Anaerolineae bacterium]
MNPLLVLATVGLFYIVIFGGLSVLRREGLSTQFAFEVLGITVLVSLGTWLTGVTVNPVLFLVSVYVLSMRARLLVDLSSILSARGRQRDAMSLLQWALRLYPDRASRFIILVNMGIVQLRRQNPKSAQELLETVLKEAKQGGLGLKYEAACHYHLGLALQRQGREAEAVSHFNQAIDTFPNSIYGRAAEQALEQRRQGKTQSAGPADDVASDD